jgi:hypothetical protein
MLVKTALSSILLLVLFCQDSSASITVSCFSFPILDLPTFGFSSSAGLYITSSVNFLTNVGADTSAVFDICVMGLAR